MWSLAMRTSMIFLINSWKAFQQAGSDRAREWSTRLLVVEAFRIHMAFLLGNGFGWSRISLSTNFTSEILILINFLLESVVEDVVHVLIALVVLVVAAKESTIGLLVVFCLHSSSAACKFKCNTEVSDY